MSPEIVDSIAWLASGQDTRPGSSTGPAEITPSRPATPGDLEPQGELLTQRVGLTRTLGAGTTKELFCVVHAVIPETTRRSLHVLLGAVALVLLIACVNVVNPVLAGASGRQRELSILRTRADCTRKHPGARAGVTLVA